MYTESGCKQIKIVKYVLLWWLSSVGLRRQTSLWNLLFTVSPVTLSSPSPQHRVSLLRKMSLMGRWNDQSATGLGSTKHLVTNENQEPQFRVSSVPQELSRRQRNSPGNLNCYRESWIIIMIRAQRFQVRSGGLGESIVQVTRSATMATYPHIPSVTLL